MIVAPIEGLTPPARQWRQRRWMLASAVLFAAGEAPGQQSEHSRLQLEFKAPASCASSVEFERRVRQRSDRISFATEPPYTGTAKVTLDPTPGSVRVRLSWSRDREGATGREFSAPSCTEAVDAAALVIAISFDPSAPAAPVAADSESPAAGATQPPAEASATHADPEQSSTRAQPPSADSKQDGERTAAAPAESDATEQAATGTAANDEPESDAVPITFGSSAFFRGVSGVAPAPMAGVGLNLELGIGKGWLAPQLRLAAVHYFGNTYQAEGGDARFEFDTLELFACPLHIGAEAYSVRPCATVVAGRLVASGRATVEPSSHNRALWILGGSLVATVRPVSVLLLSADLTIGAPMTRDSFQFAPDEFHQISQVVVSGSLGLGVEFR